MGHDVEHPAGGQLAQPREVRLPHVVGRARASSTRRSGRSPARPRRGSGSSRRRSPSRGPRAAARICVLAAGDEVGLDAELEVGAVADELAVAVDVVVGVLDPQRVLPDVERGGEAVDVLGDAELGDAAVGGGLAVALGVGLGEVLRGGGVVAVGAQVDVVIGQQGGGQRDRERRSRSARRRSSGVVTLKFSRGALYEADGPAQGLDERGVVGGGGEDVVRLGERALQDVAAEDLRRLDRPQPAAVAASRRPSGGRRRPP